jgi:hypothetical protein
MNTLLFRTRVAVLWVAVAIAVAGSLLLYLFVPGALGDMVAGEMEGEVLTDATGFFFAALGIIPLVMAGVSLLVNERVNRFVNVIAGVAFGLFGVFAVVSHLAAGDFNGHVLMAALAGALAFVIAGLGLAGLRQHPSAAPVQGSEQSRSREEATV